ncbi:MAG: flagellar hook-length control protein FliK [Defluviitaleaceae bacterium]|nr:flagellar hook-length control protein FliK [Defluviitaleaceae bacterium]
MMDIKTALLQSVPENTALHNQIASTDAATLEKLVGSDTIRPLGLEIFQMPAASNQLSPQAMQILQALLATKGEAPMNSIDPMQSLLSVSSMTNINSETGGANTAQNVEQIKQPPQLQSLASLVAGQTFSAEILDIKQGQISLKMGDGGTLNARSLVMPDARIGDRAAFVVREANQGQITLEFLRGGGIGENRVSASIIREALTAANMQITPSNASVVEDLVIRNMPIDQSNLQRAAFFRYSMPSAPFEHIQFLLENNFTATEKTVEIFEGLQKGSLSLGKEITATMQMIENIVPSSPEQAQVLDGFKNQLQVFQSAQSSQEASTHLQNLHNVSQEIVKFAQETGSAPLASSAENIADIIDFSRNITETKMYFQLPFVAGEEQKTAELHVFKKKGEKGKKASGYNATALIGLDMAFLGRVEIMVNKAGSNVSLQLRSDKGATLTSVNLNAKELSDLLQNAGFTLTQLHTKVIDEKFDITTPLAPQQPLREIPPETPARYTFDARV